MSLYNNDRVLYTNKFSFAASLLCFFFLLSKAILEFSTIGEVDMLITEELPNELYSEDMNIEVKYLKNWFPLSISSTKELP